MGFKISKNNISKSCSLLEICPFLSDPIGNLRMNVLKDPVKFTVQAAVGGRAFQC